MDTAPRVPLTEPPAPSHPAFGRPAKPPLRKRAGGALAVLAVVLAKLKTLLFLLPKVKLLATSGTMLVSIAAYATLWGWRFAVGFVVLLFVHEMGHVIQLRREGVPASAPIFIPFLGAVVGARSLGDNALAEARVGLAGPVLGSVGAAACVGIHALTGADFWLALAFVGFLLNLFNLLPVVPLDGGRAMAAMSPWMWLVGFGLLVALAFWRPNPVLILVLLFGASETWRRWKERRSGDPAARAYYAVPAHARLAVGAVYVGLAAALALGIFETHLVRTL